MTNAALRGKPDAGNPHVRFDEGEVAPAATSRRGSLLYNAVKTMLVCAIAGRLLASAYAAGEAAALCREKGETLTIVPSKSKGFVAADGFALAPLKQRLLTYNIHHCAGADGKVDLQRIADVVMRENPDFVGLNEVDRCVKRSGGVDEAAELGRIAGFHAIFAKAIPYQDGSYGVAVLSREKPVLVERVPLPGKEPRVLLLCEYANFWFGTTHFDFGTNQLKSVEIIRGVVAEKSAAKPVFLTGDWNATPESATLAAMKEFMMVLSNERCRTFHGFKSHPPESEYCIDYIAVDSGHAAEVVVTETHATPDSVTSDHNPVFASVRLSAGGGNVK